MKVQVGDVVRLQRQLGRGTVRYVGEVDFSTGEWYGVELKQPRGKHNGTVNGKQYFTCEKGYGLFVKKNQIQSVETGTAGESAFAKGTRVSYTTPAGQKGDGTLDRKQNSEWRVVPETGDPLWIDEKNLSALDDEGRERSHSNATPLEVEAANGAQSYPDVPENERRGRSGSTGSARAPGNWRVGDLVQVYSNSKQKWFDDGKIDKMHAGRIFVTYNGTATKKWLPEKSSLVKKSARPGASYSDTRPAPRRTSSRGPRSVRTNSLSRKSGRVPGRTASVVKPSRSSVSGAPKPRSASFQPRTATAIGPRGDPKTWTGVQVKVWLKTIGLDRYADAFEETNVTGAVLLDMTAEDLQKLGAHVIHTKKLMREIETLKAGGKSDKRSAFNLKQWRQAIKSKVLMNNQTIGTEVRHDIEERQEYRKQEEIEDMAIMRENIEGFKENVQTIKTDNEESRILYIKEVYKTRTEERDVNIKTIETEQMAELVSNRENIEQFKQAVALTKEAIDAQKKDSREMAYKVRKQESLQMRDQVEQEQVVELAQFREYIVAFKSGVVKIKAENQTEAEEKAKDWYRRRVTEREANIATIEQESAEELATNQQFVGEHTEQVAEIKAENEAVRQQNVAMWQQRRKTERDANVAQIEAESAEELAQKQVNVVDFKDEVVAIKQENAAMQQQQAEEWYKRRVTERAQNIATIETESAEELACKQENVAVFKEDVSQVKAENAAVKEQNIQMWQVRRKTERAANVAQIEEESAEELAYKQQNISSFKENVVTIKADNMAEALRLAEEWYKRRVTEREANIAQMDQEAAEDVAFKQENIAVFKDGVTDVKMQNSAHAEQQRQMWQERRKTERNANIAQIEHESAEELMMKKDYVGEHQEQTAQIKTENAAVAEQQRQMWNERRKTERAANIATIEHESAEELANNQENVQCFKDQVVEIKSSNAADAEAQRVEWYQRRVTERQSNIEKIEAESAAELADNQENVAVFKEDVTQVKAENEAQKQQNIQMWKERRQTERAANVAQIEAESAEELAEKQEYIVVFKDGVVQIKAVNASAQQDQQEQWYQTRVQERTSNINQRDAESAQDLAMNRDNVVVFKDATSDIKSANAAAAEQNRQGFWQARMTERAANIQSIEMESAEELAQKQQYVVIHQGDVANVKAENAAYAEAQRQEWYRQRVTERNSNINQIEAESAQELAENQTNVVEFKDVTVAVKAENAAQAEQNRQMWQARRKTERTANINTIEAESAEELAYKQQYVGDHADQTAQIKSENVAMQQAQVAAWQQARATERAANIAQIEEESAEELAYKQQNVVVHKDVTAQVKSENVATQQQQVAAWQQARATERAANIATIEAESMEELAYNQQNVGEHKDTTALLKAENMASAEQNRQMWQDRRATERKANMENIETANEENLLNNQEAVDLHRNANEQSKTEIEAARAQWLDEVKGMHGAYRDELQYKREIGHIEDAERIEAARWTSLPDSYLNAFNSMDLDGDGQIDFVEFQAAINSLGLGWDEQETWRVFNNIDVDKSGALDLDEFEAVIRKVESILTSNPDADSRDILRLTFENIQ